MVASCKINFSVKGLIGLLTLKEQRIGYDYLIRALFVWVIGVCKDKTSVSRVPRKGVAAV